MAMVSPFLAVSTALWSFSRLEMRPRSILPCKQAMGSGRVAGAQPGAAEMQGRQHRKLSASPFHSPLAPSLPAARFHNHTRAQHPP